MPSSTNVSAEFVAACQSNIVRVDIEVKQRIGQLREWAAQGTDISKMAIRNIAGEAQGIRERIRELDIFLDELEIAGTQCERDPSLREQIHRKLTIFRESQDSNLKSLRTANNIALRKAEDAERTSLMQGGLKMKKGRAIVDETAEATAGMSALLQKMESQVKASEATLVNLVESSSTIGETDTEMKTTSSQIQMANKLLSKYSRRECTDRVLIFLALSLFLVTVFYIVRKRFLLVYFYSPIQPSLPLRGVSESSISEAPTSQNIDHREL